MGENNNRFEELIDKQLSGLLSSEEYTYLRQWYNASPENKKQYEEYCILKKYLHVLNSKKRFRPSVESAYKRFVVRIGTISRKHLTRKDFEWQVLIFSYFKVTIFRLS